MILREYRARIGLWSTFFLLVLLRQAGFTQVADSTKGSIEASDFREGTVAILPFKNLSSDPAAKNLVMPQVYREAILSGFHPVFEPTVDQLLRRHRIRDTGQLNLNAIEVIRRETRAQYILLGSIDYFETNDPAQMGFSARLLNSDSGEIVWAQSHYSNGDDDGGLFGFKRIESTGRLIRSELRALFKSLRTEKNKKSLTEITGSTMPDPPVVFMVSFENLTGTRYVNQVVSNVFISELTILGYRIAEPGRVNYAMLAERNLPQGEIDYGTLRQLADFFRASIGVTGSVIKYTLVSGADGEQLPHAEITARMVEAETGAIIWAKTLEKSGSDYTVLFEIGKVRSPGRLIQKIVREMLASLPAHSDLAAHYVRQ